MRGFVNKYGLYFPDDTPEALIELMCWKHWREPEYQTGNLKDPWECFWRGIYEILPREDFVRHRWAEEHTHDWTTENFVITWGAASSGKAQPLDSVVYTPSGPRTMGEMQVGDRVIAQDGNTAEVILTHDVGQQEEYRVTFKDGSSTLCAGTHLWEVESRSHHGWSRPHVVTTAWLAGQKAVTNFSVPVCQPVYFERRSVDIPPYLMGAFIGDGCFGGSSGDGQLRFSAAEAEIVNQVRSALLPGYVLKEVGKADYMLVKESKHQGRAINEYIQACKRYGLWGKLAFDKFIPADYLYNAEPVRWELLRGLLDTDGTCCKMGGVSFSTCSPQLAADVKLLVQSLGGVAAISTKSPFYRGKNGEKINGRTAYNVSVSQLNKAELFKVRRKQDRVRSKNRFTGRRYIASVERTGRSVPMKCITIDHPRGLYLTDGFIVTHNSNDFGLLSLVDWMIDPTETVTILASTTLSMLKLRSYESVVRYFKKIQRYSPFKMPGKIRKTDSAILLDDEDDSVDATDKASIRGVAVAEGTEEEARAKLQGAHLPYVRLILDELAQMRPAAMAVRTNLAIGAKDFKLIGLCNIDSFTDLAGRHSIPLIDGGFKALDPDVDEEWRSQYGKVRRHDGLRSPAIMEPHRTDLSFLLTKPVLDQLVAQEGGNMDAPQIWTMVRAWPPSQGKSQTLLSMTEVIKHEAMSDVTWQTKPAVRVMGIDPAFSERGNRGVMQVIEVGYDINGLLKLNFLSPRYIKVDASSRRPVLEQVGEQIAEYAIEILSPGLMLGVRSAELASLGHLIGVDDSATQSVADFMMTQYGMQVRRFSANKAASEMKISVHDPMSAKERFYNQGAELWAATAAFVRADQIRGFPSAAADQLTSRPTDPDKRPLRLISKKARVSDGGTGSDSPDDMDAVGFAVGVLRFYLNLVAGAGSISAKFDDSSGFGPRYGTMDLREKARKFDLDSVAYEHAT
jgi:hypothetical protein